MGRKVIMLVDLKTGETLYDVLEEDAEPILMKARFKRLAEQEEFLANLNVHSRSPTSPEACQRCEWRQECQETQEAEDREGGVCEIDHETVH